MSASYTSPVASSSSSEKKLRVAACPVFFFKKSRGGQQRLPEHMLRALSQNAPSRVRTEPARIVFRKRRALCGTSADCGGVVAVVGECGMSSSEALPRRQICSMRSEMYKAKAEQLCDYAPLSAENHRPQKDVPATGKTRKGTLASCVRSPTRCAPTLSCRQRWQKWGNEKGEPVASQGRHGRGKRSCIFFLYLVCVGDCLASIRRWDVPGQRH